MTDFTETVKQNAVLTFSVVILSSLALTFLILLYTGIFGFGDALEKKSDVVADKQIQLEEVRDEENAATSTAQYVRVSLPMLYGSFNAIPVLGKQRGCDTVYMVDAWADAHGDALTNHLQVLFDGITPVDFLPGNYVRVYQRDLQLNQVVVDAGVARVFLDGELHPTQSSCEAPRLRIQIEEIALQYPDVTSVEIFVNGQKI